MVLFLVRSARMAQGPPEAQPREGPVRVSHCSTFNLKFVLISYFVFDVLLRQFQTIESPNRAKGCAGFTGFVQTAAFVKGVFGFLGRRFWMVSD